jgi:hypothetical protein
MPERPWRGFEIGDPRLDAGRPGKSSHGRGIAVHGGDRVATPGKEAGMPSGSARHVEHPTAGRDQWRPARNPGRRYYKSVVRIHHRRRRRISL